ncbi:MAG TPA: alpha/beta hydrolase [Vicinamibacterales bacterium]
MKTIDGYVTTDEGLRLFVRRMGNGGDIVLFLNGAPLVEDFAPLAERHTIVFFDTRNRGRSDAVRDRTQIERGIHHDIDDLETLRRHFGVAQVDVIGHSYAGFTAAMYAITHPSAARRIIQIGPMGPDQSRQYPAHLSNVDATMQKAMVGLGELMNEQAALDPVEFCRRFWAVMGAVYVMNPADVTKLRWAQCDSANERDFMRPWMQYIQPSIQQLQLTEQAVATATAPVLVVHGTKDRNAPFGAGRDWARILPNARLLAVENAAHVPWIEAPELVLGAMRTFLDGAWPPGAEQIVS